MRLSKFSGWDKGDILGCEDKDGCYVCIGAKCAKSGWNDHCGDDGTIIVEMMERSLWR